LRVARALKTLGAPVVWRWRARHPNLMMADQDWASFAEPLRPAMARVARTTFYRHADHRAIRGWITPRERQVLYAMGRWLAGPVLEVGSWLGLSTTAIARGIRDSGQPKRFDSIDLKLTPNDFRLVNGGVGLFLPGDDEPYGVCPEQFYRTEILPFISAPGGSNQILRGHLARLGLSKFVSVHIADLRAWPASTCAWVFCDATHDLREIETNAPALRRFITRGSVLVCHDVGRKPELIEALRAHLPLGHAVTIDLLYVAEVI
jgi:hypothetical protein